MGDIGFLCSISDVTFDTNDLFGYTDFCVTTSFFLRILTCLFGGRNRRKERNQNFIYFDHFIWVNLKQVRSCCQNLYYIFRMFTKVYLSFTIWSKHRKRPWPCFVILFNYTCSIFIQWIWEERRVKWKDETNREKVNRLKTT